MISIQMVVIVEFVSQGSLNGLNLRVLNQRVNGNPHGIPMSFRRHREKSLDWHKWIEKNQDCLVSIGIPREVWEDRAVWQRFLGHGYSSEPSNWRNFRFSIDDLDDEHQRLLHEFLVTEGFGPNCYGSTVWDQLRIRFDNTDQAADNSMGKK